MLPARTLPDLQAVARGVLVRVILPALPTGAQAPEDLGPSASPSCAAWRRGLGCGSLPSHLPRRSPRATVLFATYSALVTLVLSHPWVGNKSPCGFPEQCGGPARNSWGCPFSRLFVPCMVGPSPGQRKRQDEDVPEGSLWL